MTSGAFRFVSSIRTVPKKSIVYEGQLQIVDQPEDGGFYLPQIGRDVEVVGFSATATYYGNMLEAGTGMMQINIYDETYDTEEGQGRSRRCARRIQRPVRQSEGSRDQAPRISGQHLVPMGVVDARRGNSDGGAGIPARHLCPVGRRNLFRTIFLRKGGASSRSRPPVRPKAKTAKIEPVYKIEFNLTSKDGFTLKGSYTGVIPITDASDDKSDDDGTSTLERDYDMDLSKIKKAHYYTSDQVYIQGIGYKPISSYGCGLQFINIGIEWVGDHLEDFVDREPGGDIVRVELTTEPGKENEITPGTYEVTEQRWPAYIKPGVMMRGIMLDGGLHGSRWMHQTYSMWGDDNKIFEYMDGHALLYDGQVTITKVEGEGKENWYRFEVDGICVRKHHVRGTWEGPVVSQTGRAAAEKDHLEPPELLRRLPAPSVPMSRLAEELPGIMFRKAGMTE